MFTEQLFQLFLQTCYWRKFSLCVIPAILRKSICLKVDCQPAILLTCLCFKVVRRSSCPNLSLTPQCLLNSYFIWTRLLKNISLCIISMYLFFLNSKNFFQSHSLGSHYACLLTKLRPQEHVAYPKFLGHICWCTGYVIIRWLNYICSYTNELIIRLG